MSAKVKHKHPVPAGVFVQEEEVVYIILFFFESADDYHYNHQTLTYGEYNNGDFELQAVYKDVRLLY